MQRSDTVLSKIVTLSRNSVVLKLQILTSQQIDDLTSMLEPIKDLQNAVLELNDALRLDVPEIDSAKGNVRFLF